MMKNTIHPDGISADPDTPTLLFEAEDHRIYWLGIIEQTAFRCNCYLLVSGDTVLLIDPGGSSYFGQVRQRVEQITPASAITGLILCHQDPDVAASLPHWRKLCPEASIISSPRAHVLLPHYGCPDYPLVDIEQQPVIELANDRRLEFITAPHLHSPAAFVSYDHSSGFLFSGDIWAALTLDWQLICSDFATHQQHMNIFHMDYMASNIAARGFVRKLEPFDIQAILPQHGSILSGKIMVTQALNYLQTLQCGTDILYPDLS